MARLGPVGPRPERVLLSRSGGSAGIAAREKAVVDLLSTTGAQIVVTGGDLPNLTGFGAIVLLGIGPHLGDDSADRLAEAARAGASILALLDDESAPGRGISELLGVTSSPALAEGEWFPKVVAGPHELTDRLPDEFSVVDRPVAVQIVRDDARYLLAISVAHRDLPVVTERRLGAGRVLVSGLGATTQSLSSPAVTTVLRRALAPAGELASRARTIGMAVLGYGPYGGMGLYHGLAAAATPGLELIGACDSDPGRRKAAEEEFPGLRPYATAEELLTDDDVELVVVATPPSTHFTLARQLLDAGRHVALEKPMCLTVAEADELIELAALAGLVLTVHQSRRWDGDFVALRDLIGSGAVGSLFNVETFVGGFEHPCRAWHSEVAVSGGAVYDWGSHHLDWILQLMGTPPTRLVAHGHKRVWHDVTNLDQVRVRLSWPDGREAQFLQSDLAGVRPPKFFVQGTAGTIAGYYRPLAVERVEPGVGYVREELHHAEAPVSLELARYESGTGLTRTTIPPRAPDRYGFHVNLADHLLYGEPLAVTPESAREVVALLEAAQRSTDEGNVEIRLDLHR